MFHWSRLEIGVAVALALLILVGGTVQWFMEGKGGIRTVIVEARSSAHIGEGRETPVESKVGDGDEEGRPSEKPVLPEAPVVAEAPGEAEDEGAEEGAVDERININTAQPSELQRLPGIGPALAQRIVEYRQLWGAFDTIEDIMEVSGIGPVKFANMKHLIKVR